MENIGNTIAFYLTTYGLKVIGVLIVLFAAWIFAGFLQKLTLRNLNKAQFDPTLSKFFGNIVRWAVLIFAGIACLGVFGIQTTSFAALIAGAGLAIGLAFQGTLSNIAAGVMLLIFRPFKIGSYITVAEESGTVEEIDLFTTTLQTLDNRKIIIPNGSVFGATIENVTAYPIRRVDIPVGVDYGADIDATRKILEVAAKSVPGSIQDPEPQVFLAGLGASSVDWQVRVWCKTDDYWDVFQATIRETKMALDAAKISIPFPQMDIHFDQPLEAAINTSKTFQANA